MPIIGSLLNNDWYNFPMSGAMRKFYPQVKVCYEFVNRNKDFPLANYIDLAELRDEIEKLDE